jgi:YcxB-like protein
MDIRMSCGPDPDGYERAIRFAGRRSIVFVYVFALVFVLLGLVTLIFYDRYQDASLLSIGVPCLVLAGYLAYYPRLAIRRAVAGIGRDGRVGHDYLITDQTLTISSVYAWQQFSWYVFLRAREIPGQILLYVQRNRFIPVPTAGMTPEQLHQLRTFLAQRDWSIQLRPVVPTQPLAGQ